MATSPELQRAATRATLERIQPGLLKFLDAARERFGDGVKLIKLDIHADPAEEGTSSTPTTSPTQKPTEG